MRPVVAVLDVTVALSSAAALLLAPKIRERRPGRLGPEPVLAVVVALILLNQLLFAVYIQRVHHGDTSFIARYFLPGWFDVPRHNALVDWLAHHLPGSPALLSPTLLRVQAFLELPLVLLSFAAVLRRLDTDAYLRAVRSHLVPLASASYTVAFCAVEWDLHNPYTADDIVVRALSALLTPVLLTRTAKPLPGGPRSPVRFTLDLWAFGALMLALYDTALLYNSARLAAHLPAAALALAVLTATRFTPARSTSAPGPRREALTALLARALVLFLVPALAIRYRVSFAHAPLAAAAALLVLAAALRRDVLRLALPAAAGVAVGGAVAALAPGPYFEATVLRGATAALLTTVLLCALLDGRKGVARFRKGC